MAAPLIDSKKDEFRAYLEKGGVIDALTKVLVGLYEEPEKPGNALEFVAKHIQGPSASTGDVAQLREENEALKREIDALKATVADLQKRVGDAPADS